jgi:hypothetical protein
MLFQLINSDVPINFVESILFQRMFEYEYFLVMVIVEIVL